MRDVLRAAAGLVALSSIVAAPSAARAHDMPVTEAVVASLPSHALAAAPAPPVVPMLLVLAVAALFALSRWRPRRAVGLALAITLSVFAFEKAVHSVHHLDDHQAATHCSLAVASTQLAGTLVDSLDLERTTPPAAELPASAKTGTPASASLQSFLGRAPPLSA